MRQFRPATVRVPERADPAIRMLFKLMNEERLTSGSAAGKSAATVTVEPLATPQKPVSGHVGGGA